MRIDTSLHERVDTNVTSFVSFFGKKMINKFDECVYTIHVLIMSCYI